MNIEGATRIMLADYYAAHREELVTWATCFLQGNRMMAEDFVQTTFLRLLTSTAPICPSSLPSLVSTTLRRLLLDMWRHRRYERDYEHDVQLHMSEAESSDVFSICSARQTLELLEQRIARMVPQQARILRMSLYEEKSVSEISQETGLKYKAVEYQLGTARRQLRHFIG